MKLARTDRSLIAWMLYLSLLFGAFACSIGHGQMAALQLSGLDGLYCSANGNSGPAVDLDGSAAPALNPASGFGCALCSTFMGLVLAALFGWFGLLPRLESAPSLPAPVAGKPVRYLWPSANPRASPFLA